MYTISFVRFFSVIKAKGTSGGTVPHRSGPGVGVRVTVGVPETARVAVVVPAVAVTVPVSAPANVDVSDMLAVPLVSAAVVAVLVARFVAVGVFVNVGGGVLEGGSVGVGNEARVSAACVRASATDVACESPAEIGESPGMHALNATDNTRTTKNIRWFIHTSWDSGLSDDFHELADYIPQHSLWERSHLSVYYLAFRNKQHCRNALNAKFARPFGILVCVHFGNQQLAGVFLRKFIQNRRDHFAGSAPRRPEINDYRKLRLQDGLLESIISDVNGFFDHWYLKQKFLAI